MARKSLFRTPEISEIVRQWARKGTVAGNVLILGASYRSLLAAKLLMAGHNVTLACRGKNAALTNHAGAEVRIKLRGQPGHRPVFSRDLVFT